jgi:outer membrane protein
MRALGSRILVMAAAMVAMAAQAAMGQQITRIAVLDVPKILQSVSPGDVLVQSFEQKKVQVQNEIDRMEREISRLTEQKSTADRLGDVANSSKFQAQINERTKAYWAYVLPKKAELDEEANRINDKNPLMLQVMRTIREIAETEGYSLVINLKASSSVSSSILWFSPMIDITDKVIQVLATAAP